MQNNCPPQPTNVNEILSDAAAKAMIQTGAIARPSLFTPLFISLASGVLGLGLVSLVHIFVVLGVLDAKWKPNLWLMLPAGFFSCAIVGRSAIALSTVEEIKVKKSRVRVGTSPIPVPTPEPQWVAPQPPAYAASYQEIEDLEPEAEEYQEPEEELIEESEQTDYHYQEELDDVWGDRERQTVRH